ncbi:MAG: 2-dehydropantoate 2-reductase [Alphaproteobacteria bacterium]|nr:2-dehydropantoate 2-reductase [Alphaproteobacteria bacterium]
MDKKIAVLATGANGSCIAADLTRAGLDVSIIDQWAVHIEEMRANGLTIRTKQEDYNVAVQAYHLSDVCTLNEKFDIVLLTSKAYDSRWLTEFIKPYLADDGLLVAVQNCMTAEMIGDIVGLERTVGCVVELSSQLFEPADITRNTEKARTWFGLGAFDPAHADRVEDVAEVLRHAGNVDITDDILSAKWMKLIVNAMTMALKAILGTTNEQVFKMPGAREMFLRSGEEALAAGQLLDYKVVPIFGLGPEDVENTNSLLETLLEKITHDVGPTALNTVLQDHMKGRYSEIDMINGLIAEEGRQRGKSTPVSDALVEITKRIHTGELKPDPANFDLVRDALQR